jgi:hypothetical protein
MRVGRESERILIRLEILANADWETKIIEFFFPNPSNLLAWIIEIILRTPSDRWNLYQAPWWLVLLGPTRGLNTVTTWSIVLKVDCLFQTLLYRKKIVGHHGSKKNCRKTCCGGGFTCCAAADCEITGGSAASSLNWSRSPSKV